MDTRVFPIAPAGPAAAGVVLCIIAFVLCLALLFAWILHSLRAVTFEVSPVGVSIRGGMYGRVVPAADLRPQDARIVDLAVDGSYAPRVRTNGVGLPGYLAGWFRLKNGEKALLFLTRRSRAVYVPTTRGYSMLLSPEDAEGFTEALRTMGSPSG
jgi:hypothetical protein